MDFCQCYITGGTHSTNCPLKIKEPISIPEVPEDATIPQFTVKDSGKRQSFESGMVRDLQTDKLDVSRVFDGPMLKRWADHITKGAIKYPDIKPGIPNWTLANSEEELVRFKKSAARHFLEWYMNSNPSEDAAAGVFFNINGAEFVKDKLKYKEKNGEF